MSMSRFRAAATAALVFIAGSAGATEPLQSQLGAVLGQERSALAAVPAARIAMATAPQVVAASAGSVSYTEGYLASQSAPTGASEWQCLSEALYFEARGESVRGLFAVGEVILNRRDSRAFPGSVCGVVHQGTGRRYACQFTYTCDGQSDAIGNKAAYDRVARVARALLDGAPRTLTGGATHYHTNAVRPSWARVFRRTATIGAHRFYRQPTRTASN